MADFLPVAFLMLAGAIVSTTIFLGLRGYYVGADRQRFEDDATYYGTQFKSDVDRHVTSLAAIHAFVSASHVVNRWEFSAFAHQILPQNSGFKAVLWLPQLSEKQRLSFESNLQRDGLYGLKLRELTSNGQLVNAIKRPQYLPVAYVEPFESSGDLIGVDLQSNGIYARLFQEARQTGRQVASGPVPSALVAGVSQPIVLVAFPLIQSEKLHAHGAPESPEGYVLGVLQLQRVIADAIDARSPIEAAIAYGQAAAPVVFLERDEKSQTTSMTQWFANAEFHRQIPFEVAGQNFYLVLRSAAHGNPLTRFYAPLGAALLVMALTALLGQSMAITVLGKREVERAVIERTAELQALNHTLSGEIEQRRQAETALWNAKDKAESANRAKTAFLSIMSHELRTPLNAIIGFSSMLGGEDEILPSKSADYIREINGSGIRLLELINDILEITQMDAEEKKAGEHIYVYDLVEAVVARIRPLALAAGVTVESSVGSALLLQGDNKRLQRALFHLLSNAVKFSEPGGCAWISAEADRYGLAIEVTDKGAGMAAGITDFFSQIDASFARKHDGVGLGLTYVRRAAQQHDATVEIVSSPGEGTRVILRFPASRVVSTLEVA